MKRLLKYLFGRPSANEVKIVVDAPDRETEQAVRGAIALVKRNGCTKSPLAETIPADWLPQSQLGQIETGEPIDKPSYGIKPDAAKRAFGGLYVDTHARIEPLAARDRLLSREPKVVDLDTADLSKLIRE